MRGRNEPPFVFIQFLSDSYWYITKISVKSRPKARKEAWIELRLPSNKFLSGQALLSAVFRMIPPMMLLSCTLKVEDTVGVLWRE